MKLLLQDSGINVSPMFYLRLECGTCMWLRVPPCTKTLKVHVVRGGTVKKEQMPPSFVGVPLVASAQGKMVQWWFWGSGSSSTQ